MRRIVTLLALFALIGATAAWAEEKPEPRGPQNRRVSVYGPAHGFGGPGGLGRDAIESSLYPPELVMRSQLAIGMTEDQMGQLKSLLGETHGKIIDLQVDLERSVEKLTNAVKPTKVDEAAALAAAETTMELETQLKKTHLMLLVRIKNLLDEEQQRKLDALRPVPPERPARQPREARP